MRAARFSPAKAQDSVSAAAWGFGLTLLGLAAAVILRAVFPKFFGPGLSPPALGLP